MTGEVKDPKKDNRYIAGGLFIPAGLFIGLGIGWALDYIVQGVIIGLGVGFLLFGVVMLLGRD